MHGTYGHVYYARGAMAPLQAGDPFPNLRVDGVDGAVDLRSRWRDGPLVVMFMRHFGCAFCREQLIRMGRALWDFKAAGADVVAIFQYGAEATQDFCRSREVPFDCVGDPLREAYAEVSLGRGERKQILSWKIARRYAGAIRTGAVGGGAQGGDMAQLPGTFVIGTDGRLTLAHYATSAADNPRVDAVLEAVRRAPGATVA